MTPLDALAEQARQESAMLAYPNQQWVKPVTVNGTTATDVLVIGGGQSGLVIAQGLRSSAVTNVNILDQRPAGQEGVWDHFARMQELRTPKYQNGADFGQPGLSVQTWFQTKYGRDAWDRINRIPRQDWMDYLRWYRATLSLPVENEITAQGIHPGPQPGIVTVETSHGPRHARQVVLATGFDGGGGWKLPPEITAALPPDRYDHACTPIDFTRFKGKRLGILGHGASAFDAAVAALQHGAASVDLCFRRPQLPTVNPHRHLETAGMMAHWPSLSDRTRWNIARHMRLFDQPPAVGSYQTAIRLPGFALHPASPWTSITLQDGTQENGTHDNGTPDAPAIHVTTPHRSFHFDHVVCATGYALNLAARPELARLANRIVLWRDRFHPDPQEDHPDLGAFPYLSPGYAFQPLDPADDWITRIHAFNLTAFVSAGPHSTSISGQKHALPRLLRALVERLLLEQEDRILPDLRAYDEQDLIL
jgi:cation diffusion facilitator CzcD-associated flavoprotein CzcO